jgi:hypothetical protein
VQHSAAATRNLDVGCMLIRMAAGDDTRALGRGLIDTFGIGWARPDLDVLMSVYAPEAVFVETPFSEALRGTEAIRRYWLEVPYNQSDGSQPSSRLSSAAGERANGWMPAAQSFVRPVRGSSPR